MAGATGGTALASGTGSLGLTEVSLVAACHHMHPRDILASAARLRIS
jgi:hypothetical protein